MKRKSLWSVLAVATVAALLAPLSQDITLPAPADAEESRWAPPEVIARVGDPSPSGGKFSAFGVVKVNDKGNVAFSAGLSETPQTQGVFIQGEGAISKVAAIGDDAPTGGKYTSFGCSIGFNNMDEVAFDACLDDNSCHIFLAQAGRIAPVVSTGDLTPLGGTYWGDFGCTNWGLGNDRLQSDIDLNDSGQVSFGAPMNGGSTGGLFLWSGGAVTPIAWLHQAGPDGPFYSQLYANRLTDDGTVVFSDGPNLYEWQHGATTKLFGTDQVLPGGGTINWLCDYDVAPNGRVLLSLAYHQPDARNGFFEIAPAGLQKVVATGDALPEGITFGSEGGYCFGGGSLNSAGDVAFPSLSNPPYPYVHTEHGFDILDAQSCGAFFPLDISDRDQIVFTCAYQANRIERVGPLSSALPNRDIVFVRGIDSTGACDGADNWVESYLSSSTGKSFFPDLHIGKYLHFDYLSGGNYTCPRSDNAYTPLDTCHGVANAAGQLKDLIDSQATAKVTIIGHSMGGLVAAYLVGHPLWHTWAQSHIASVVTFDTPLRGIPDIQAWLKQYFSNCSLDWPDPSESLLDLADTSPVVHEAASAATDVPFYPLDATQMDLPLIQYVPRHIASLDHARPFHIVNSCTQPGADQNTCEPPKPVDDNHSSIWARRFDDSQNDKAFLVGCAAALWPDCALMMAPAAQGVTTDTHTTMAPDLTQVTFISHVGSIVRMTLIAPDGTTYGPDGAGPVLSYAVDDVSETYVIDHPVPGDWIVRLYGVDVPPEGEQVPVAVLAQVNAPLAVGGIAELPDIASASAQEAGAPGEASGWSATKYGVLAGGATAALLALAAGAWYARRRWLG